MASTLSRSIHIGAVLGAVAWTALSFGATLTPSPAQARSAAPFYTAELAQPADQARAIAGGVAWNCRGTSCVAGKGRSRPLRMCRELQREFGEISAFVADGEALPAEDLARCNR